MLFLQFSFIFIISPSIISIWARQIQENLFDAKAIKVVRMGQCSGANLPFQLFAQVGKCTMRSGVINNFTVIVKKDLKDKLKVTISINRCGSRENLDTCEEYYKMRNLDFCQSISPDTFLPGVSSPFIIPYTPPMKCPIKRGTYYVYNHTFNLTPFMMFNLDGWYWKVKSELSSSKENNKIIGCVLTEGYTKL